MKLVMLWSNDPEFYDLIWGEGEVGKPIIKINGNPEPVINKFRMAENKEMAEDWMEGYFESNPGYKYICVVCDGSRGDNLKEFAGSIANSRA